MYCSNNQTYIKVAPFSVPTTPATCCGTGSSIKRYGN